eukprot:138679-Heterocapsa_arctica.AAC.1
MLYCAVAGRAHCGGSLLSTVSGRADDAGRAEDAIVWAAEATPDAEDEIVSGVAILAMWFLRKLI